MDKLQDIKINYNLLNEFPGAKRLGNGVYRVNPCPKCGGKDHFTLFEPNSSKTEIVGGHIQVSMVVATGVQ